MSDGAGGEERFIQSYMAPLAAGFTGALDLTDDCAFLRPLPGHEFVLKTDPICAGVHYFADDAPSDIAWKALAANVSDLAAKAARPVGYLLALSFPEVPDAAWMRDFVGGLRTAQDAFGCVLLGGDTDRASGPQRISVTAIGEVRAGRMVRRSGARPGDRLYVSGTLGGSALGLALRLDPTRSDGLSEDAQSEALNRYLRPAPRLGLRAALGGYARSAMDISDGLIKDLDRMCRLTGVGAELQFDSLPLAAGVRQVMASDPAFGRSLISAGDDYEVLAAVPEEQAEAFVNLARKGGVSVSEIGRVTDTAGVAVRDADSHILDLGSGYDHFRN